MEFRRRCARSTLLLSAFLDTGPTGVRSRSQSSQSEVTEGLGLRHWES